MSKKITCPEFLLSSLSAVDDDPFKQFARWWHDAIAAGAPLVDAMHLSTVDEHGHPDGRIVLLKDFDERGFVFFTNYQSAKAQQLMATPFAAMTIFWSSLERQIRMRGIVEKTSMKESQDYFSSRPRGAQIGAWSSPQSRPINNRDELEDAYAAQELIFVDKTIPCPPHWGGFRLVPNYFEFWQGRKSRLHDRIAFTNHDGAWRHQRLAP